MSDWIEVAPEVAEALASGRAVVALETTLVTHGLPAPQGAEVAAELEATVREHGAVPATVALLEGRARVGIDSRQLARLASSAAVKVNLGNLASVLADGKPGSTTVAATLSIASRAGIRVFATGGIGGVHREEGVSGDVSADLTALSCFPVAAVCAGAKAVLDLPRTVERLETLGVPVLGYRTEEFPSFYRRSSGLPVDGSYDTPASLARAIEMHWRVGGAHAGGVVVANPVPVEAEMPAELYERALRQALSEPASGSSRGRGVTPRLLSALAEATGGRSVAVNRALLANNAQLAAELATAINI